MIKNLGQSLKCTKIFSIIFFTAVCNILFVSCDNSETIELLDWYTGGPKPKILDRAKI